MLAASASALQRHEELFSLIKAMRFAARQNNWAFFLELGQRYTAEVAELELHPLPEDTPTRERCAALLQKILDTDTEIQQLSAEQLRHIRTLIAQTQREKRLHQTYIQPQSA